MDNFKKIIPLGKIELAQKNIRALVRHTPLIKMLTFSEKYDSNIYFKREDL